jgi:predicted PurR-regulated permease PerM
MPDAVRTKWGIPIWVWVVGGLVAVGWLAWSISGTLAIVAASFLLAYALDPLVDRLVCWRVPRGLAIAVVLTVILLAVTLVVFLIVPRVIREISTFVVAFPSQVERTWQTVEPWLREQGFEVPRTYGELGQSLNAQSGGLPERVASAAGNVVSWVAGSTVSVANWIMTVALVPVLTFYLLYSLDDMRESSVSYIPERHRPAVIDLARDIDQVVAQFIRGQLLVMLFLAFAYSTAYSIVGVPLAIPIGILAGVISFIPYVGGAVALGAALLSCVLTGTTGLELLFVVLAHATIQGLEGFVITPRVMSGQVGLPAFWVIVALLAFGDLFGLMGVLVAVPVAAVIKVLLIRAAGAYRRSAWFNAPAGAPAGAGVPSEPS